MPQKKNKFPECPKDSCFWERTGFCMYTIIPEKKKLINPHGNHCIGYIPKTHLLAKWLFGEDSIQYKKVLEGMEKNNRRKIPNDKHL